VVDQVNSRAQQEENVLKMLDLQNAVALVHGEVPRQTDLIAHLDCSHEQQTPTCLTFAVRCVAA
jgi:hypothetical protein